MKFVFQINLRNIAPCDFPPKIFYFPLPQESVPTTFNHPESPGIGHGETHSRLYDFSYKPKRDENSVRFQDNFQPLALF